MFLAWSNRTGNSISLKNFARMTMGCHRPTIWDGSARYSKARAEPLIRHGLNRGLIGVCVTITHSLSQGSLRSMLRDLQWYHMLTYIVRTGQYGSTLNHSVFKIRFANAVLRTRKLSESVQLEAVTLDRVTTSPASTRW